MANDGSIYDWIHLAVMSVELLRIGLENVWIGACRMLTVDGNWYAICSDCVRTEIL